MLFGCLIGSALGILAGIFPGIHSNTFAALLVFSYPFLSKIFSSEDLAAMITTSAIAYTISNIIPTIFLGVPSEDTAIGVLPTHEMVLEGKGIEALSLSAFSSFFVIFLTLPLLFTAFFVSKNYETFEAATPIVLATVAVILILSERGEEFEGSLSAWRKRFYAFLVFLSSGFLGYVSLSYSELAEVNPAGSVLLPLLTGLFGAPILFVSSFSKTGKIPEQNFSFSFPRFESLMKGSIAGFFVSIFPGISSGIATVMASFGERREGYIAAMSAANTSNAISCFFMFIFAEKTRSGAAKALKDLNLNPDLFSLLVQIIFASLIAFAATMLIGTAFASKISKLDVRKLSKVTLIALFSIVFIFTRFFGVAVFLSAAIIGMSANLLNVRRVNCMGCLILPLIIRYLH